ncbi:unnamed protein product, partial [Ectocarpus sp. 12 AP-2014]
SPTISSIKPHVVTRELENLTPPLLRDIQSIHRPKNGSRHVPHPIDACAHDRVLRCKLCGSSSCAARSFVSGAEQSSTRFESSTSPRKDAKRQVTAATQRLHGYVAPLLLWTNDRKQTRCDFATCGVRCCACGTDPVMQEDRISCGVR